MQAFNDFCKTNVREYILAKRRMVVSGYHLLHPLVPIIDTTVYNSDINFETKILECPETNNTL